MSNFCHKVCDFTSTGTYFTPFESLTSYFKHKLFLRPCITTDTHSRLPVAIPVPSPGSTEGAGWGGEEGGAVQRGSVLGGWGGGRTGKHTDNTPAYNATLKQLSYLPYLLLWQGIPTPPLPRDTLGTPPLPYPDRKPVHPGAKYPKACYRHPHIPLVRRWDGRIGHKLDLVGTK